MHFFFGLPIFLVNISKARFLLPSPAASSVVKVTADSRWDLTKDEEPINVIDGNPLTWWSSLQTDPVTLAIDFSTINQALPVSTVCIFWGDDGGRIRPCSGAYEVQLLMPYVVGWLLCVC